MSKISCSISRHKGVVMSFEICPSTRQPAMNKGTCTSQRMVVKGRLVAPCFSFKNQMKIHILCLSKENVELIVSVPHEKCWYLKLGTICLKVQKASTLFIHSSSTCLASSCPDEPNDTCCLGHNFVTISTMSSHFFTFKTASFKFSKSLRTRFSRSH